MWYRGQKVVCIRDDWAEANISKITYPQKDQVYTIRYIFDGRGTNKGIVAFLLEEIKNPEMLCNMGFGLINTEVTEPGFNSVAFRPLVENKKSTETGMKILDDLRKSIEFDNRAPVRKKETAS